MNAFSLHVVHLKILKRMKHAVGLSPKTCMCVCVHGPKILGIVLSSSDIDGIVIFNGQ